MPYKRHEPISEHDMLKTRYVGHHTICQILREIYIETGDESIKWKCRIAMSMAKSMHEKLKKYKKMTEQ